jgi:hypothetical protein
MVMLQKLVARQSHMDYFHQAWFDFAALVKFLIDRKPGCLGNQSCTSVFLLEYFQNAKKRKNTR